MTTSATVYWEENTEPIDDTQREFLNFLHRYEIKEPSSQGTDRVIAVAFSEHDAVRITRALIAADLRR